MTPTPAPFDFRKPPPGELGRRATAWLAAACRRAAGPWARALPFETALAVGHVEVVGAGAALAALPDDAVAVPVVPAGADDAAAVLVLRRPFLLALLAGLVGEVPAALPADREPTELEGSLVGYAARELFLDPLERGWPEPDGPALSAGAPGPPKRVWAAGGNAPTDLALFATLDATAPFGQQPVYLLVPRGGPWAALAAAADARPRPVAAAPAEQIEALVREMPVELEVLLGTADLTMRALGALRAGDVLVLNQKVDEPLDGLLAGARKFRVWPGVVGSKAAVLIDAPAE